VGHAEREPRFCRVSARSISVRISCFASTLRGSAAVCVVWGGWWYVVTL
jgi:hypothetical protein